MLIVPFDASAGGYLAWISDDERHPQGDVVEPVMVEPALVIVEGFAVV